MSSVLIIESNDFFRRSFREILKMYIPSLVVYESADGAGVLATVAEKSPDMVFLDIRIPGRNGLELARQIKEFRPDVKVSIFTNCDLPEYRAIAEKHGADYFLLKDAISGAEIAALIRAVAARKRARGGAVSRKARNGPARKGEFRRASPDREHRHDHPQA